MSVTRILAAGLLGALFGAVATHVLGTPPHIVGMVAALVVLAVLHAAALVRRRRKQRIDEGRRYLTDDEIRVEMARRAWARPGYAHVANVDEDGRVTFKELKL